MTTEIRGIRVGDKVSRLPIVQGQMALRIGMDPLAGAVAAAGGIGLLSATGIMLRGQSNTEIVQRFQNARRLAGDGIVGMGIMFAVSEFDDLLDVAIQERADLVCIGAGFMRDPFNRLAAAGIPGFAIISSVKLAGIVARVPSIAGVVVECGQAGGHLGPPDVDVTIWELFPPIYRALREGGFQGPVIAAGGLRYGWEMRRIMEMGADGVQLGTLFAMTTESSAAPVVKEAWLRAKGTKVVRVSPVGMPGRVVAEQDLATLPRLAAPHQGCIDCLKHCPHRDDPTQKHCIHLSLRSSSLGRIKLGPQGEVYDGLVFAGGRVGEINDIVPAAVRIQRLMDEFYVEPPDVTTPDAPTRVLASAAQPT
ncbi:MAG: nitronate monooxygenase [Chloroflexi bacterium]|nr:nitronate monooxygenase [Chloroflexota bacterium]